jgi:hypothetical protein
VEIKPPTYRATAFNCPHCGALCQQDWATCWATGVDTQVEFDPNLETSTCFACGERAVWLRHFKVHQGLPRTDARLLHPTTQKGGPPRVANMPPDVAVIYDEASEVVNLSARSASALLRLALQLLLQGLYPKHKDKLNLLIKAAVADGLPPGVQQTMDYIRFTGNESVHNFHHDDTTETANTLFGLLNFAVERLITQPQQLEALYGSLPETFRKQVDERDA